MSGFRPINDPPDTLPARFVRKVHKAPSGCWLWAGAKRLRGYGRFIWRGREVAAHRFAYVVARGEHAEGLELDHLCRQTACVNHEHLEAVAHRVNIARGDCGKHWRDKTRCPQGHAYAGANLYIAPDGGRACKQCSRERHLRIMSDPASAQGVRDRNALAVARYKAKKAREAAQV